MKNTITYIMFFFLSALFANSAFWWYEMKADFQKTISELNSEIKAINTNVLNKIKATDIDLNYFIRNNLTSEELFNLSSLINSYNLNNISKQESELIENKKNLYSNLTKYINQDKIEEYKTFITNDVNKIKQSLSTKESIDTKTEIIKEKKELAKEKITENNEFIKEQTALKIDQKLTIFKTNKDFVKLDIEIKEKVLDWIIWKADNYINILNKKQVKTNVLIRKIEAYEILRDKLELFKKNL